METNNGERIYIDYLNMNYENFDIYQKSHFKRYIYAKDLIKNKIVGDFACGTGYGTQILSENNKKVIGIDLNKNVIDSLNMKKYSNIEFINRNLLDLNFNSELDSIVSFETIEHLDEININKLFKLFNQSLVRKGLFVFSTPYMQKESEDARRHHSTFQINENKVEEWCINNGFSVLRMKYQNYISHEIENNLSKKDFIICESIKI